MKLKRLGIACVLAAFVAGSALAHHSFALFDNTKTLVLKGTVKEYQWSNPHVWIQLMVPNAAGVLEEWPIESASVAVLSRRGWDKHTVKPGDQVTVTVNPLRDGSKGGSLVNIILPGGKALAVVFS